MITRLSFKLTLTLTSTLLLLPFLLHLTNVDLNVTVDAYQIRHVPNIVIDGSKDGAVNGSGSSNGSDHQWPGSFEFEYMARKRISYIHKMCLDVDPRMMGVGFGVGLGGLSSSQCMLNVNVNAISGSGSMQPTRIPFLKRSRQGMGMGHYASMMDTEINDSSDLNIDLDIDMDIDGILVEIDDVQMDSFSDEHTHGHGRGPTSDQMETYRYTLISKDGDDNDNERKPSEDREIEHCRECERGCGCDITPMHIRELFLCYGNSYVDKNENENYLAPFSHRVASQSIKMNTYPDIDVDISLNMNISSAIENDTSHTSIGDGHDHSTMIEHRHASFLDLDHVYLEPTGTAAVSSSISSSSSSLPESVPMNYSSNTTSTTIQRYNAGVGAGAGVHTDSEVDYVRTNNVDTTTSMVIFSTISSIDVKTRTSESTSISTMFMMCSIEDISPDVREVRCSLKPQHANIVMISVAACILAFLYGCIKLLARCVTSNDKHSQKNVKKKKKKMIKPTLLGNEYDYGNGNGNGNENENGVATQITKKTSMKIKPTLLGKRSIMPGRDLDENDIHRLWKEKEDYMTQQQSLIQSLQQTIAESETEKARMTQQILERDTELHKTKTSLASLTHALSVREGDVKELRSTLSSHNSTIIHLKHELSSGEGQERNRLEVASSLQHALSRREEQLRELTQQLQDQTTSQRALELSYKQKIKEMKCDSIRLRQMLHSKDTEASKAHSSIADLKDAVGLQEGDMNGYQVEMKVWEEQVKNLQYKVCEGERVRRGLEEQVTVFMHDISERDDHIHRMSNKLQSQAQERKENQREMNHIKQDHQRLCQSLEKSEHERERIAKQMSAMQEIMLEKEEDVEKMRSKMGLMEHMMLVKNPAL